MPKKLFGLSIPAAQLPTDPHLGVLAVGADLTVLSTNQAFLEMVALPLEQVLGAPLEELLPRSLIKPHAEALLANGTSSPTVAVYLPAKNLRVTLHPLRRRKARLLLVVRNLSVQDYRVEALEQTQELFHLVLENARDYAIFTLDPQGYVMTWNPGAERVLGYAEAEIVGRRADCIFTPADRAAGVPAAEMQKAIRDGRAEDVRWHLRKNGEHFWANGVMTALRDARGNLCGFAKIMRDHTAHKEADDTIRTLNAELARQVEEREAELALLKREMEGFFYALSHDLRSPLRAMDGFSHILLDEHGIAISTTAQEALQRVRRASQHMGQVIDALLELSRISRHTLCVESVSLSRLVERLAAQLRAGEAGRDAEFVIAPRLEARGDRKLLRLALEHLLDNAWKFTRDRAHTRIEFGVLDGEAERTVYFLRDNGAGFDMRYAGQLFGLFQRLHDDSRLDGLGIGLATAQRVIHRHGGEIWAESMVDRGSTFYFTLT